MSNRSQYELEQIKLFLLNNNIQDVTIENVRQHRAYDFNHYSMSANNYVEYLTEDVRMYKLSIPESKLERIVHIVTEFEELMRDPETAKLLMEARFINRLKYGSKI